MLRLKSVRPELLLVCLLAGPGFSQEPKGKSVPAKDEVEALIDRLVEIDQPDTGYSGGSRGTAFLPLGQRESSAFLLPPGRQTRSDALKSLVKLGTRAVPKLLEHLSDTRPTKFTITDPGLGSFSVNEDQDRKKEPEPTGRGQQRYTVMVGDLCYVALGQIVNRPYSAVEYIPSGNVSITSVPRLKELREDLVKQWGKLTPDKHREALIRDIVEPIRPRESPFEFIHPSHDRDIRNGASIRLAYYYPDAFEPVALQQLARPTYDVYKVHELVRSKLYPAKTAKERKELVQAFIAKYGDVSRDGIRWQLFDDLSTQEADEEGRVSPKLNPRYRARECLTDVFGSTPTVKSEDRPKTPPFAESDKAGFIETLLYDRSQKIDRVIRDLLATDVYFDHWCLNRLVGRGYDADIDAHLKRKLPLLKDDDRRELEAYRTKLGWTWLHATVELGVVEMVEAALRDKGDPNAKGRDGRTPLHIAAEAGLDDVAEVLIRAKADPNIKDAKGRLPVEPAANKDHMAVVRRLVTAGSAVPDVFTAAIVGATDRMTALLKEKPDRRGSRNEEGLMPLHLAALEGHVETARVLLAAGADVKAVDRLPSGDGEPGHSDGYTPLHLAAMGGKRATAELLIDRGADVNAGDEGKYTPLHHAAAVGDAELVKLLLARKADRNTKGFRDRTPLDLALEKKHDAVIKLLQE
jgi:ankyrin repeat protein